MAPPATDTLLTQLRSLLVARFEVSEALIEPQTPLRELGLDSMMIMDVIMDIEDRLQVKLADLEMPRDARIADVIDLVQRNFARGN